MIRLAMNKFLFYVLTLVLIVAGAVVLFSIFRNQTSSTSSVEGASTNNTTLTANPSQPLTQITMDELSKHADIQSCWLLIDGKVYDVTTFIPGHPGGKEILKGCGKDATELYNTHGEPQGKPHSQRAQDMLTTYLIGEIQ